MCQHYAALRLYTPCNHVDFSTSGNTQTSVGCPIFKSFILKLVVVIADEIEKPEQNIKRPELDPSCEGKYMVEIMERFCAKCEGSRAHGAAKPESSRGAQPDGGGGIKEKGSGGGSSKGKGKGKAKASDEDMEDPETVSNMSNIEISAVRLLTMASSAGRNMQPSAADDANALPNNGSDAGFAPQPTTGRLQLHQQYAYAPAAVPMAGPYHVPIVVPAAGPHRVPIAVPLAGSSCAPATEPMLGPYRTFHAHASRGIDPRQAYARPIPSHHLPTSMRLSPLPTVYSPYPQPPQPPPQPVQNPPPHLLQTASLCPPPFLGYIHEGDKIYPIIGYRPDGTPITDGYIENKYPRRQTHRKR